MPMNRTTAELVKEVVLECARHLDTSVATVQAEWNSPQAELYRRLVGQVMGRLYTEVLAQVYRSHPELEPQDLKAARAKGSSVPRLPPELVSVLLNLEGDVTRRLCRLIEEVGAREGSADSRDLEKSLRGSLEALTTMRAFVERAAGGPK